MLPFIPSDNFSPALMGVEPNATVVAGQVPDTDRKSRWKRRTKMSQVFVGLRWQPRMTIRPLAPPPDPCRLGCI